jgi:uncharacterized membrane protein YdcZ (DUF606 family)
VGGIVTVHRLGALRLSLAIMCGQLLGGAIVDVVAPINGQHLTFVKVLGVGIMFVAVGLAAGMRRREMPRVDDL